MSFFKKLMQNIKAGFNNLFTLNLTPKQLALSITVGFIVGTFPILGTTTIICFALAFIFRLNIVVLQFINYLCSPLQLILMVPYFRAGALLFLNETYIQPTDFDTLNFITNKFSFYSMAGIMLSTIIIWAITIIIPAMATYHIAIRLIKKHPGRLS